MSRWTFVIALLGAGLFAFASCKRNPPVESGEGDGAQGGESAEEQCREGGGLFDPAEERCVCLEDDQSWDGESCEEESTSPLAQLCEADGGSWSSTESTCECPEGQSWEGRRCAEEGDQSPQELCEETGGDWSDEACACPEEKVLENQECVAKNDEDPWNVASNACEEGGGKWFNGSKICQCSPGESFAEGECREVETGMTAAACESAPLPGTWSGGKCECSADRVFSPLRGGCTPALGDDGRNALDDICENPLNGGTWNADAKHCECPEGRTWFEERCVEGDVLSDLEVCESAFNEGTWDRGENTCDCPAGAVWLERSCRSLQNTSEQKACSSDVNGGDWDEQLETCICPGEEGWVSNIRRCDSEGATAAEQLCINSGGRPGNQAETCQCGSAQQVATLDPQGYEYCVNQEDNQDDLPDWLLILLGILQ